MLHSYLSMERAVPDSYEMQQSISLEVSRMENIKPNCISSD